MLSPASTIHYSANKQSRLNKKSDPIYSPVLILFLLMLIKPFDWLYKLFR